MSVAVALSRLYRQKSRVFVPGGGRGVCWSGQVKTPRQCAARLTQGHAQGGDFLLTGTIRFGEAWLGCAPRYADFLRVYRTAQERGTNPCHVETD